MRNVAGLYGCISLDSILENDDWLSLRVFAEDRANQSISSSGISTDAD